jgi:hypothetical protein
MEKMEAFESDSTLRIFVEEHMQVSIIWSMKIYTAGLQYLNVTKD